MRSQLTALRSKMKEKGIDLYIIPTTDYHGSEYVNDHFKFREYVSGFTGSAGTLAVGRDFAGLWTDGRYFLQAGQQLSDTGITLMKMGEPGVPELEEYIASLSEGTVIGFDGRVISHDFVKNPEQKFRIVYDLDMAEEIWPDRPEIKPSRIYEIPLSVTGETSASKLSRVRSMMKDADYLLVSKLEDIAWLYNLRGRDIANTPVFYAFALISRTSDTLYVMDKAYRVSNSHAKDYYQIFNDLRALRGCSVMLDQDSVSYSIIKALHPSVKRIFKKSPTEALKAVKNDTEILASKNAHIRDGAAMANFIYWLKHNIGKTEITEISLAARLEQCRRRQGAYDLSFSTIAGYEDHGAVIHYSATEESSVPLKASGFVLVDSGGQYEDGTTDITRTIALGPVTDDRKKNYTAVLKGHIALAAASFTADTTGSQLDILARTPIRENGLDFNHGTGHGVGHMLSVHEGPNTISPRGKDCHIIPGMITTDEPGVYLEGQYGIRIENELLCIEQGDGTLAFEAITMCPYEREAIRLDMLTEKEIRYINDYHNNVYETLAPLLKPPVREWLAQQCSAL